VDTTARIITDIDAVITGVRRNRESLEEKATQKAFPAKRMFRCWLPIAFYQTGSSGTIGKTARLLKPDRTSI